MRQTLYASTTRHAEWGGPKRWVRIHVHDSVEAFRQSAEKYSPNGVWEDKDAGFHPAIGRSRWNPKTKLWEEIGTKGFTGVMDFCIEHLSTEIVVHECVHAAIAIYRMDIQTYINLGGPHSDREENLAYITGDLTDRVFAALRSAYEGVPSNFPGP